MYAHKMICLRQGPMGIHDAPQRTSSSTVPSVLNVASKESAARNAPGSAAKAVSSVAPSLKSSTAYLIKKRS